MRNANLRKLPSIYPHSQIPSIVVQDLQKTINPMAHLPGKHNCHCQMCNSQHFQQKTEDLNIFKTNRKNSIRSLKKILDGLTLSVAKTLKLFLPDMLFVSGECLQVFQTSRKQGRIIKFAGTTPLKGLYPTFLRMRRQYKSILQQRFNESMLDKINPEFMHLKYFQKLIPSHFNDGLDSRTLNSNKNNFKNYVLHHNDKYQIQQIEEHKMNETEPFCIVKYTDGNSQLFNQAEFEIYVLSNALKIHEEVSFIQSYIKYKLQSDSIYFSEYTFSSTTINEQMDLSAQQQVMVLLGGLNRYDQGYHDIQTFQEMSFDKMMNKPQEYVQLMTYKIVHFLAMASRIYVEHIKIKWIANDLGNIYLQEIMEVQTSELPRRFIKFKLPPKDETLDFYNSSQNFIEIYKDMRRRKVMNTLIIKKQIDQKTYEEVLQIMDPQGRQEMIQRQQSKISRYSVPHHKKINSSVLSKTIDVSTPKAMSIMKNQTIQQKQSRYSNTYEEHLKQHPQIVMKNRKYDSLSLDRPLLMAKSKDQRVDSQINSHFLFKMTNQDKQLFSSKSRYSPNIIPKQQEHYLQKKMAKTRKSLLYDTFSDLNQEKIKQMSSRLNQERVGEKLRYRSSLDKH